MKIILVLLYFTQNSVQVFLAGNCLRMLKSKPFFINTNCFLAESLRLSITALSYVESGKVVEPFGGNRVI